MTITTTTKASEWGKAICDWQHGAEFDFVDELVRMVKPFPCNPLFTVKNADGIYVNRTFSPGMIKDVKFFPPATKMTFIDGTVITTVAQEGDEFSKEIGMMNCIMEYIFRGKSYNNVLRKWIKKDEQREKEKVLAEQKAKEEKETKERQAAKEKRRKAARAEREKERQIEIQKEAYLRAMKEAK